MKGRESRKNLVAVEYVRAVIFHFVESIFPKFTLAEGKRQKRTRKNSEKPEEKQPKKQKTEDGDGEVESGEGSHPRESVTEEERRLRRDRGKTRFDLRGHPSPSQSRHARFCGLANRPTSHNCQVTSREEDAGE
ncbi:Hypothetical protein NTJ_10644 [Nesidiocoris tenuis]|nr:Hypothetical protein NTJ_10644 [Nesidiocoris tenuis]